MILSAVILAGLAAVVAFLAALAGLVNLLAKSPVGRPFRWIWRTLITVPVGSFVRREMEAVVREVLMKPNGGSSIADVSRAVQSLNKRAARLELFAELVAPQIGVPYQRLEDGL